MVRGGVQFCAGESIWLWENLQLKMEQLIFLNILNISNWWPHRLPVLILWFNKFRFRRNGKTETKNISLQSFLFNTNIIKWWWVVCRQLPRQFRWILYSVHSYTTLSIINYNNSVVLCHLTDTMLCHTCTDTDTMPYTNRYYDIHYRYHTAIQHLWLYVYLYQDYQSLSCSYYSERSWV